MGWWVGFECVELGEQIAMPVEEGAIHPARRAIAETLISSPAVLTSLRAFDDALATASGVGTASFQNGGSA